MIKQILYTSAALVALTIGTVQAQQLSIPQSQSTVITTTTTTERTVEPTVIAPAQVMPMPQAVVITQPTAVATGQSVIVSRSYVPQGVLVTNAVQAAPFSPAPVNTFIETTADRRVVQSVDGYKVVYEINGKRVPNEALVSENLDTSKTTPTEFHSLWPLEVGKSTQANVDMSDGVHAVTTSVVGTETIAVPAGVFYTYVIERRDRSVSDNSENVARMWYAPSVGTIVKYDERLARAGRQRQAYEAVSIRLPHAPPGTRVVTVTHRADTPEARAQFCAERGTAMRLADGRILVVDCPTYVQADRVAYDNWLLVR